MAKLYYSSFESPIGRLHVLVSESVLLAVAFDSNWPRVRAHLDAMQTSHESENHPLLTQVKVQLSEYFSGQRTAFHLPLDAKGTVFQRTIWQALQKIPYGQTWSYSQQAAWIGHPKAVRAVGHANGLNPLCIVVPCHRVISKNGNLSGYAGGREAKSALLRLETQHFR